LDACSSPGKGTSKNVTGPYEWTSRPTISTDGGENPAFVTYKDPQSGKLVYSLWIGGAVRLASSPDGPFVKVDKFSYPGGNPVSGGIQRFPGFNIPGVSAKWSAVRLLSFRNQLSTTISLDNFAA
jgi:hypothetical protein